MYLKVKLKEDKENILVNGNVFCETKVCVEEGGCISTSPITFAVKATEVVSQAICSDEQVRRLMLELLAFSKEELTSIFCVSTVDAVLQNYTLDDIADEIQRTKTIKSGDYVRFGPNTYLVLDVDQTKILGIAKGSFACEFLSKSKCKKMMNQEFDLSKLFKNVI